VFCLFICGLFNDVVSGLDFMASNDTIINKYDRGKESWRNLRHYSRYSLTDCQRQRKNTKCEVNRASDERKSINILTKL
jgi:hypothetical protein